MLKALLFISLVALALAAPNAQLKRQLTIVSSTAGPVETTGFLGTFSLNGSDPLAAAAPLSGTPHTVPDDLEDIPTTGSILADINIADGGTDADPEPDEQESVASAADGQSSRKRAVSGNGVLTVSFSADENEFDVAVARCSLGWETSLGAWQFLNGTFSNSATFHDIYRDVCATAGIPGNGGHNLDAKSEYAAQYGATLNTAIQNNINIGTGLINSVPACSGDTEEIVHAELRKLQALTGNHWSFLFLETAVGFGVGAGAVHFGNENATAKQILWGGAAAGILTLYAGASSAIQQQRILANVDRQIMSAAIAALNRAAGGLADTSGPPGTAIGAGLSYGVHLDPNAQQPIGGGQYMSGSGGTDFNFGTGSAGACLTQAGLEAAAATFLQSFQQASSAAAEAIGLQPIQAVQAAAEAQAGGGSCA